MWYKTQQTCLGIAILGLLFLPTSWFKETDYIWRCFIVVPWGIITVAGLIMAMLANARQVASKRQSIAVGFYDGQYIGHTPKLVVELGYRNIWPDKEEWHIIDLITEPTEIRILPWYTTAIEEIPLPYIEATITVGTTGTVTFGDGIRWFDGFVPVLEPDTRSVIRFYPCVNGVALGVMQVLNVQ